MSFIEVFLEFKEGKETEDYNDFAKNIAFETALKKQIERLLYNTGEGRDESYFMRSYFFEDYDLRGDNYLIIHFGLRRYCEEKFYEYIGDKNKSSEINLCWNSRCK